MLASPMLRWERGLVRQRLRFTHGRLERDGVIRGYLTSIDPQAVNQTLLAFVRVMAAHPCRCAQSTIP